jgi:apolipoprotein N-acyltransferase
LGLSIAVDAQGHVLAATDFLTSDPQVMVASVPMQRVHTIYATIGDLFPWLSLVGLVGLIARGIARRSQDHTAGEAAPGQSHGAPPPISQA